jgi:murein DD-endopeptidase MepM/ murein hydrolase activator NlpD
VIPRLPLAASLLMLIAAPAAASTDLAVTLASRAMQPGEVVRVDIACACAEPPTATAFGVAVPLSRSGDGLHWKGLIGIDLAVPPGPYAVAVTTPDGRVHTTPLTVASREFLTRTLTVAGRYVEPPPAVTARIVEEASLLKRLFSVVTPAAWERSFALPLATAPAPNFGSRSIFNGEPRQPHAGVDFSSPAGTRITAPGPGRVAFAGDLFFTGGTVIVDHGAGLYSLFAHLSSMAVRTGDEVGPGAVLGRVGATGRATGPHLHWSVRLGGARVDPLSLVAATAE